jgi:hypothetical protein
MDSEAFIRKREGAARHLATCSSTLSVKVAHDPAQLLLGHICGAIVLPLRKDRLAQGVVMSAKVAPAATGPSLRAAARAGKRGAGGGRL